MVTMRIELESDAVQRLEAAKWTPAESFSEVVRRAQYPAAPHTARELLEDFAARAGHSPLSEAALDRLAEVQQHPRATPSHWTER